MAGLPITLLAKVVYGVVIFSFSANCLLVGYTHVFLAHLLWVQRINDKWKEGGGGGGFFCFPKVESRHLRVLPRVSLLLFVSPGLSLGKP